MPPSILISYATRYGSTKEVAEQIKQTLSEAGLEVEIIPAHLVKNIDLYELIILGAPLIMFRWHNDAKRFLKNHRRTLQSKKLILFALGPITTPYVEKEWLGAHAQLDKELNKFPWLEPVEIKIFGGRFDLSKAGFLIKKFAGNVPPSDAMDLSDIRDWASSLAAKYGFS